MITLEKPPLDEALLKHFGVKGMHWGIRKEDKPSGRTPAAKKSSGYELSDHEKAVLKAGGVSDDELTRHQMDAKYGPNSTKPSKPPRFTSEQKRAAAVMVGAAGVAAGVWYLNHRTAQFNLEQDRQFLARIREQEKLFVNGAFKQRDLSKFHTEWGKYVDTKLPLETSGYTKELVDKLSSDSVHLSPGAILKRVSTQREGGLRPGGFYASHQDADVERYKAILPVFWRKSGRNASSGYIVNIKANSEVKAPSPKHTYDMFRNMLNDEVDHPGLGRKVKLRDLYEGGQGGDDDAVARRIFPKAASMWIDDGHLGTRHFFGRVKNEGYNALVDMNDAGTLSSRPLRLLDSDMFSIAGHDVLTHDAILDAQENIMAIAHRMLMMLGEDYLAHFGIKGMKWGVRREREPSGGPPRQHQELTAGQKKAIKVALVAGGAAAVYVMAKRGQSPATKVFSNRANQRGRSVVGNILKRVGKMSVKTITATVKTTGKVGFKVGKVTAKGTAKVVKTVSVNSSKKTVTGIGQLGRKVVITANNSKLKLALRRSEGVRNGFASVSRANEAAAMLGKRVIFNNSTQRYHIT